MRQKKIRTMQKRTQGVFEKRGLRPRTDEYTQTKKPEKKGVSHARRARQRKKQQIKATQTSIYLQAVESVADGIFIINTNTKGFPLIFANAAFLQMFGLGRQDIIGKEYLTCRAAPTDVRLTDGIKKCFLRREVFYSEILNYRANGEKIWTLLRLSPVVNGNDSENYFVGIQTDVSQLRREELLIKIQREELLHMSRVGKIGELVSSLAHEINQPLTAILAYAQAAKRMLANGDQQLREIMQHIINDDLRATGVIQRLRKMLKKEAPRFVELDINQLIEETVGLITTDIILRNKVLKTDLCRNLPRVRGDRMHLQQVLLNLISNSLEAMERIKDSEELLIQTSYDDSGTVRVAVKDSGHGITAEHTGSIFAHYFTTKSKGLGMGLAISRAIIETHGGILDFKNNPLRGTTFYFTLPAWKKDAP